MDDVIGPGDGAWAATGVDLVIVVGASACDGPLGAIHGRMVIFDLHFGLLQLLAEPRHDLVGLLYNRDGVVVPRGLVLSADLIGGCPFAGSSGSLVVGGY